jgi:hypothetical protein
LIFLPGNTETEEKPSRKGGFLFDWQFRSLITSPYYDSSVTLMLLYSGSAHAFVLRKRCLVIEKLVCRQVASRASQKGAFFFDIHSVIMFRAQAARPRHRNAIAPFSISLRSISAFGGTEKVKIAYAVTGIIFSSYVLMVQLAKTIIIREIYDLLICLNQFKIGKEKNTSHRISSLGRGPGVH